MYEIQPAIIKMVEMDADRVFLILFALIMYSNGVSKLVIGAILVSLHQLYMFYEEHKNTIA